MYSVLIVSSGVSRNFKKYSQKFLYDWFNLIILTKAVSTRFFIFQDLSCLELFRHTSHIHLNKGLFWDLLSCFVTLVTKYSYLLVGKKKKKKPTIERRGFSTNYPRILLFGTQESSLQNKSLRTDIWEGQKGFRQVYFFVQLLTSFLEPDSLFRSTLCSRAGQSTCVTIG